MNKKLVCLISGIVVIVMLTSIAIASNGEVVKNIAYNNIKIMFDGKAVEPKDSSGKNVEPFIMEGTTYLPVRALANAFGKDIKWDSEKNTVVLTSPVATAAPAVQPSNNITAGEIAYKQKALLYDNPLKSKTDVKDFVLEGSADISFPNGMMRMKNALSESNGQAANYVYWCPKVFPSNVEISWKFRPVEKNGLAMMFFGATGVDGMDLFDPGLAERTGEYKQYHSGDINAYHISYFRRSLATERSFHVANMRKSKGFHLVAQGADPIPDTIDADHMYNIKVVKLNGNISFYIENLLVFQWKDDGSVGGSPIQGGRIGFRQLAPLVAEYSDFKVYEIQ